MYNMIYNYTNSRGKSGVLMQSSSSDQARLRMEEYAKDLLSDLQKLSFHPHGQAKEEQDKALLKRLLLKHKHEMSTRCHPLAIHLLTKLDAKEKTLSQIFSETKDKPLFSINLESDMDILLKVYGNIRPDLVATSTPSTDIYLIYLNEVVADTINQPIPDTKNWPAFCAWHDTFHSIFNLTSEEQKNKILETLAAAQKQQTGKMDPLSAQVLTRIAVSLSPTDFSHKIMPLVQAQIAPYALKEESFTDTTELKKILNKAEEKDKQLFADTLLKSAQSMDPSVRRNARNVFVGVYEHLPEPQKKQLKDHLLKTMFADIKVDGAKGEFENFAPYAVFTMCQNILSKEEAKAFLATHELLQPDAKQHRHLSPRVRLHLSSSLMDAMSEQEEKKYINEFNTHMQHQWLTDNWLIRNHNCFPLISKLIRALDPMVPLTLLKNLLHNCSDVDEQEFSSLIINEAIVGENEVELLLKASEQHSDYRKILSSIARNSDKHTQTILTGAVALLDKVSREDLLRTSKSSASEASWLRFCEPDNIHNILSWIAGFPDANSNRLHLEQASQLEFSEVDRILSWINKWLDCLKNE
jgi:hypothetical protein